MRIRAPLAFATIVLALATIASARQIHFATAKNTSTGGTQPDCIGIGDFNRNGKLDAAVTNQGSNTLTTFLGFGNGTFQPAVIHGLDPDPIAFPACLVVGDFNEDKKLDVIVATTSDGSTNNINFFAGKGDGTFQPMVDTPVVGGPLSFVAADLNKDHHLDLFLGQNPSSSVMLGNGNGTFQPQQTIDTGGHTAWGAAIADFNHDGNPDIAIADYVSGDVGVMLGNGDGTFQPIQTINIGGGPSGQLAVGDFNRDGKLDLAVARYSIDDVAILLGKGDGTFLFFSDPVVGAAPGQVQAADFNKDGKLDLVVTNFNGGGITVLQGRGDGSFNLGVNIATGASPAAVTAADFNKDGSLDVAVANYNGNTISVLLNLAGTFVKVTSSANPSTLGQSVTFQAAVTASVATTVPTGQVTFLNGSAVLGTVSLSAGKASLTTSSLTTGKHKITVKYSGDTYFNPNVSGALTQTVN